MNTKNANFFRGLAPKPYYSVLHDSVFPHAASKLKEHDRIIEDRIIEEINGGRSRNMQLKGPFPMNPNAGQCVSPAPPKRPDVRGGQARRTALRWGSWAQSTKMFGELSPRPSPLRKGRGRIIGSASAIP